MVISVDFLGILQWQVGGRHVLIKDFIDQIMRTWVLFRHVLSFLSIH